MLQADPGVIRDRPQIFRLFVHETQRVFHDRLINNEDKMFFHQIMSEMASKHFGEVCIVDDKKKHRSDRSFCFFSNWAHFSFLL